MEVTAKEDSVLDGLMMFLQDEESPNESRLQIEEVTRRRVTFITCQKKLNNHIRREMRQIYNFYKKVFQRKYEETCCDYITYLSY